MSTKALTLPAVREEKPNNRKKNRQNHVKKTYDRSSFQVFIYIFVIFCTLFSLLSLIITLLNAMKNNSEIIQNVFSLPTAQMFEAIAHNFSVAWNLCWEKFIRSIIIALVGATLDCLIGAVLAYIFTYKDIKFKEFFFTLFISVMLLPSIMGMPILVPFMRDTLQLHDSYVGYLLPMLAGGQVTALFLFRTFFGQQPKALFENAQVEGANDFKIFWKITFPLAFPIIMYHFVGTFSSLYNDYLWASLILDEHLTLMPFIKALAQSTLANDLGSLYALYIISAVPLAITSVISMKFFASGDFAAGMKL